MDEAFDFYTTAAALACLPGALYLLLLSLAALLPQPARRRGTREAGRLAIVVPAHNEAASICGTTHALLEECRRDDQCDLWVVADNCTDDTAHRARQSGAQVLERQDNDRRGKGFALKHAFEALAGRRYAWYIVIDADSTVEPGFLDHLRTAMQEDAQVVQACYLSRPARSLKAAVARLAQFGFNLVRPLGRRRLGFSAGIFGNGFALRAQLLERLPYTARSVVEDLEYHLALINADISVSFAQDARVWGEIAESSRGACQQRARWEGGRLRMLREHAIPLLRSSLRGSWRHAEVLADLLLPPLGLFVPLMLTGLLAPALAGQLALLGPLALACYLTAIGSRAPISRKEILALAASPAYVLWKLSLLPATLARSRPDAAWERSERRIEQGDQK